jgi:long-chain acyl-CoA synthetase
MPSLADSTLVGTRATADTSTHDDSTEPLVSKRPWIASYGDRIPADIDADAYPSVVHLMDAAIGRHRDRTAFRSNGNALSYAEFDGKARAFAAFPSAPAGRWQGRPRRRDAAQRARLSDRAAGHRPRRRGPGERQPAVHARELEHQLNDAGVEVIVAFDGSTPTLAEVVAQHRREDRDHGRPGRRRDRRVPGPAVDARLARP